jgi:hypothetical protein
MSTRRWRGFGGQPSLLLAVFLLKLRAGFGRAGIVPLTKLTEPAARCMDGTMSGWVVLRCLCQCVCARVGGCALEGFPFLRCVSVAGTIHEYIFVVHEHTHSTAAQ